jgi:hypothetical protein
MAITTMAITITTTTMAIITTAIMAITIITIIMAGITTTITIMAIITITVITAAKGAAAVRGADPLAG